MNTDFDSASRAGESTEARKARIARARQEQRANVKLINEYMRVAKRLGRSRMDELGLPMNPSRMHKSNMAAGLEEMNRVLDTINSKAITKTSIQKPKKVGIGDKTKWQLVKTAVKNELAGNTNQTKPMSDMLFKLIGTGIGSAFGSPEAGQVIANTLKGVWDNRGLIAEAWRKVKNFFSGLFRKKKSGQSLPRIAYEGAKQIANSIRIPEGFGRETLTRGWKGAQADLEKLARENIGVAQVLLDKPNMEGITDLLKKINKDGFITINMPETLDSMIKQASTLNEINQEQARTINQAKNVQEAAGNALANGDLGSLNTALTIFNQKDAVVYTPTQSGGIVLPTGLQQETLEYGGTLAKVLEERNTLAYRYMEAEAQKNSLINAGKQMAQVFNDLVRQKDEATRRQIAQTNEDYQKRLASFDEQMDIEHKRYIELQEQLANAQSQGSMAQSELNIVNHRFEEVAGQLMRLQKEREALMVESEIQKDKLNGAEANMMVLYEENRRLQSFLDEAVPQIKKLIAERENQQNALIARNNELVSNANKIATLEAEKSQLESQILAIQVVENESKKLIEQQGKELAVQRLNQDNALVNISTLEQALQDSIQKEKAAHDNNALIVRDYENRIAEVDEQKKQLIAINERMKGELEVAKGQIEAGNAALVKVDALNELIKRNEQAYNNQLQLIKLDNEALERSLKEAAEVETALRMQMLLKSEEALQMSTEAERWRKEALAREAAYQQQIRELNELVEKKQEEIDTNRSELEQAKKELDEARKDFKNKDNSYWSVMRPKEYQDAKNRLRKAEEKVKQIENKTDKVDSRIEACKRELAAAEKEYAKWSAGSKSALYPREYRESKERLEKAKRDLALAQKEKGIQEDNSAYIEEKRKARDLALQSLRDLQRRQILLYKNGPAGLRARIGKSSGGAYLVGSAPDWNLQPNQAIRNFWTEFYNHTYHIF